MDTPVFSDVLIVGSLLLLGLGAIAFVPLVQARRVEPVRPFPALESSLAHLADLWEKRRLEQEFEDSREGDATLTKADLENGSSNPLGGVRQETTSNSMGPRKSRPMSAGE